MDKETEKRMMAKFHKKPETELKLMGTHWYIKDRKGGVNPTALAKPTAIYVKKFWEAELKKHDKKASSLAATSTLNPKAKTATVTPTKKPKKMGKKVDFAPASPIKTRSKSKSPPKREILALNEEEWPTPREASPTKNKMTPNNIARDITPTPMLLLQ